MLSVRTCYFDFISRQNRTCHGKKNFTGSLASLTYARTRKDTRNTKLLDGSVTFCKNYFVITHDAAILPVYTKTFMILLLPDVDAKSFLRVSQVLFLRAKCGT